MQSLPSKTLELVNVPLEVCLETLLLPVWREEATINLVCLVSWVKRTHQNVEVNALKMQVEHMGAGTWSAAFVITGKSSRSFFWGSLTFRGYKPRLCVRRRWGGWCVVCLISVFRRGLGLLCSLSSLGLWQWFLWGEWCQGSLAGDVVPEGASGCLHGQV